MAQNDDNSKIIDDSGAKSENIRKKHIIELTLGVLVICAIYFILRLIFHIDLFLIFKNLILLKYFPQLGKDVGFGILFLLGILTSFHCIGMCGGIAISQTIRTGQDSELIGGTEKRRRTQLLFPAAQYNLGRIISYTVIGGIVGGLGQVISFTGLWKGIIPIIGGLFMIILGINLLGIFPWLRRFNIPVPSFAAKKLLRKNNYSPIYIGLLTGLMPCGPLQIVQLYALGTRSVFLGALSMFVFSIGTVPLLFAFGAVNTFINKKYANRILKISAAFVVILGFVMIARGLALSGINLQMPMTVVSRDAGIAHINGAFQTVTTSIKPDSFPPIVVQKGIPVKWVIKADAENLNECNNAITIPMLKIEKKLIDGDNVVEFTPAATGEIPYTCWMGMIKSKITVVDDLNQIKSSVKQEAILGTVQADQAASRLNEEDNLQSENKCGMSSQSTCENGQSQTAVQSAETSSSAAQALSDKKCSMNSQNECAVNSSQSGNKTDAASSATSDKKDGKCSMESQNGCGDKNTQTKKEQADSVKDSKTPSETGQKSAISAGTTEIIKIKGMMCEMCVQHIKEALSGIKGVNVVSVEVGTAVVTVNEGVSDDILSDAVDKAGYKVISISKKQ